MKTNVIFFGHSHIYALKHAVAAKLPGAVWQSSIAPHFVPFHEVAQSASVDISDLVRVGEGGQVHEALVSALQRHMQPEERTVLVSLVGGNAHMVLGLMRHPQPFDFVLPDQPGLPLDHDARILPSDVVRAALNERIVANNSVMAAVSKAFAGTHYHLESPPPIGDDAHVKKYLDPYFRDRGDTAVASRYLRYKLWRLHSDIVRDQAKRAGITFVPPPSETTDQEGFLVPNAFPDNATHGNPWYGSRVLQQVESIVSAAHG